jgi:hypothetical protein
MAVDITGIFIQTVDFLWSYIFPAFVTLVIALLTVSFAFWVSHRRSEYILRSALRAEIETNVQVAKALADYAKNQVTSEATVQPMPKFYSSAYTEYKRAGLLLRLPLNAVQEIENLYLYEDSVNEAGRRQEDLAFGPSSAYPNANNLRLQNLQYIIDTVHNVIKPYRERVREMRL